MDAYFFLGCSGVGFHRERTFMDIEHIDKRLKEVEEQSGQQNAHLEYLAWLLENILAVLEISPRCTKKVTKSARNLRWTNQKRPQIRP
jgi:hypothetical protein